MKRVKLIACKLLQRELSLAAALCPGYVDITFLRQELHATPARLREALQAEIDAVESGQDLRSDERLPDAIVLGYGLCSNAVTGLHSSRVPLIIPRAHDCTTLLLGSKERYKEVFNTVKGTSFLSLGWLERGFDPEGRDLEQLRAEYMEKYEDEDAVEYLMSLATETMAHYSALSCIFYPGLPGEELEREGQRICAERQWSCHPLQGDDSLLRALLAGDWDEERFLTVLPGQTVVPSYDEWVIAAE